MQGDQGLVRLVQRPDFRLQVHLKRVYEARVRGDFFDWLGTSMCSFQWLELQGRRCLLQQYSEPTLQEWKIPTCSWLLQQSCAYGLCLSQRDDARRFLHWIWDRKAKGWIVAIASEQEEVIQRPKKAFLNSQGTPILPVCNVYVQDMAILERWRPTWAGHNTIKEKVKRKQDEIKKFEVNQGTLEYRRSFSPRKAIVTKLAAVIRHDEGVTKPWGLISSIKRCSGGRLVEVCWQDTNAVDWKLRKLRYANKQLWNQIINLHRHHH